MPARPHAQRAHAGTPRLPHRAGATGLQRAASPRHQQCPPRPDQPRLATAVMDATNLPRRVPRRRPGLRQSLAVALALCAAGIGAQPAWLQAKAALAQVLLQSAWSQSRDSGDAVKPWPWADTHPVARLSVPRLAIDQIVLAGDAGRVLAFGPGWAEA